MRISPARPHRRLTGLSGRLTGLSGRLTGLSGCGPGRGGHSPLIALALSMVALSWMLLGAGQAWASGSASYFSTLTGAGQSLVEERYGASTATLPSGELLIAGGFNGSGYLQTAELFNPATDTFSKLTGAGQSLGEARYLATAAVLPSGEVLIAGGFNDSSGYLQSAELFNPATDTFSTLTGTGQSLGEAREGAVAATLPSGEVLIAGGLNDSSGFLSSAELFDPATDTFSKLTGAGQSLGEARWAAVAAALPSGEVLIAGGYNGGGFLSSAELFDPATDTFSKLTGAGQSLGEAREGAVAATLPSGEVLIAGGLNGSSGFLQSAELFNPATDTFSTLTGAGQSLTAARYGAVAATLPSGEVLIAGGNNDSSGILSSAELFLSAAQAQIEGGSFGEQTVGERSAVEELTVVNVGAQALQLSGATLSGASAADFTVSADACEGATLGFRQECTISVSFEPTGEGAASATLTLKDNETEAALATLSGTGVAQVHGPQGATGATGAQGAQGEKGEKGATGAQGAQGASGATGATGAQGEEGASGATGQTGAQGVQGATGASGARGEEGPAGATGPTGASGAQGQQGAAGATGAAGAQGAQGATGASGETGKQGSAGAVELVICRAVSEGAKGVQRCEVKEGSSPFRFTGTGHKIAAELERGRGLYAKGFQLDTARGRVSELLLRPRRGLAPGRYELVLKEGGRFTHHAIVLR